MACACGDFDARSERMRGQVGRDGLQALWNGERLAARRDGWRRRNEVHDICRGCRHYMY